MSVALQKRAARALSAPSAVLHVAPDVIARVRDDVLWATEFTDLSPETVALLDLATVELDWQEPLDIDVWRCRLEAVGSKRTYVHPYTRDGHRVSGYWRGNGGHRPDMPRDEFARLLDALPTGTTFTLSPKESDGYWNLRGTWQRVSLSGLPFWFNNARALHRTSADFHTHAARHVLDALDARRQPRERDYAGAKKASDFLTSPQVLVENGTLPSIEGMKPSLLRQREIQNTFDSIDKVHRVHLDTEPPPKVPIISHDQQGGDASYRFDNSGALATPVWIRMAKFPGFPEVALSHEFGHYLDQQVFGRREDFGSRQAVGLAPSATDAQSHALRPVMDAISQSDAVKRLVRLAKSSEEYHVNMGGTPTRIRLSDPEHRKFTHYLLMPEELFGRAYSQWIAERSRNERMRADLAKRSPSAHQLWPQQWDDSDFKPIADAFDRVFGDLGWLPAKKEGKATVHVRPYTREGHPVAGYVRHTRAETLSAIFRMRGISGGNYEANEISKLNDKQLVALHDLFQSFHPDDLRVSYFHKTQPDGTGSVSHPSGGYRIAKDGHVSRSGEDGHYHDLWAKVAAVRDSRTPGVLPRPRDRGLTLTQPTTADDFHALRREIDTMIPPKPKLGPDDNPYAPENQWHAEPWQEMLDSMVEAGENGWLNQNGATDEVYVARDSEGRLAGMVALQANGSSRGDYRMPGGGYASVMRVAAVPKGKPGHTPGTGSALMRHAAEWAADRRLGVRGSALKTAATFYSLIGMHVLVADYEPPIYWTAEDAARVAGGEPV